ncbi:hypothetical protein L1887_27832 [Cichorium endivia]|nr:hypothetical protein L1887_27832 [Cichorium endivia]
MIQYGTAILMEIGYGEAMRFHLFQAMQFHISQRVHIQLRSHRQVMEYHSECQPLRDATGKPNKNITSDTYSDDDDFVKPPPVTLPIQKLVTKLFYTHVTRVENATIKSSRCELIHWTSPMLKDKELEELSTGGFGNVVISSHHTNMNLIEQEEDGTEHEEDDDVAAPERDCVSPGRDTKEVAHETPGKYEVYNVEEIIREINFNFNAYRNTVTEGFSSNQ